MGHPMNNDDSLPPEFGPLVYSLADEPLPVRQLFYFVMTLLMLDDEQARLVSTEETEGESIWTCQTASGDTFRIVRPPFGPRQEQVLMEEIFHTLDLPF